MCLFWPEVIKKQVCFLRLLSSPFCWLEVNIQGDLGSHIWKTAEPLLAWVPECLCGAEIPHPTLIHMHTYHSDLTNLKVSIRARNKHILWLSHYTCFSLFVRAASLPECLLQTDPLPFFSMAPPFSLFIKPETI